MREVNVKIRNVELPDLYTDTELMETLEKEIKKGWVLSRGHEGYSLVGPGTTRREDTVRDLLNSLTKERILRFL